MSRFRNLFRKDPTTDKALTGDGYSFFFGATSSGRVVTERLAM
ncbi:hypothetical protein [Arcanobacterium canis]